MDYKLRRLKNGVRVITVPMPSLESATITVWVATGSRFEERRINGISHFLEHMVFKGSSRRPTARAISEVVDGIGGEFNAATSKDWTNFYIKSRVGTLETAMDVLSDMVLAPILDTGEIEREKGTIIQELAMYEDTPIMKIQDVFEGLAFGGHPLGWDIGGDAQSVRRIKRSDFLKYRGLHYHPENILVTVAGGVTEKKVIALAQKYFSQVDGKVAGGVKSKKFKSGQKGPQVELSKKKVEQAHIILGFMCEGRNYEGRFAQSVLSTILAGPMSSRLFTEVRERRGLAYAVKPTGDKFDEAGFTGVYAGVAPKKAEEAIKVMLDQIYGLAEGRYPLTEEEVKRTKEYIKGHIALSLENTSAVGDFFAEQELFKEKVLTPEEIYRKIDKVTIMDITKEAKKLFVKKRLNLAIIGPYTNSEKFKKLLI